MNVPDWYALILLSLAAYRTWRLIAEDDILDRPRRYVTRLGEKWEKEGDPLPAGYRLNLAKWINCPWCMGFWLSALWWGLWQAWPQGTEIGAALAAISALVGLTERMSSDA